MRACKTVPRLYAEDGFVGRYTWQAAEFDPDNGDFEVYLERLECFIAANDIAEEKKLQRNCLFRSRRKRGALFNGFKANSPNEHGRGTNFIAHCDEAQFSMDEQPD
ncbi:hypothetical protein HPB52_025464 [Rhipicephalus sanguineus]|uniref:Uncharacterized protein n=1 Tax=Rhipicephalus sanguineus TaxID=34632 RepID=A0A9D4YRE5_RHISA|nr:hypothetical protein HPB52_025464 [Rhipicephalus sanguineus]